MRLFERVTRLLAVDIDRVALRGGPRAATLLDDRLRDMEDGVAELRRAAVAAVARVQRLERRLAGADGGGAPVSQIELHAARRLRSDLLDDMVLLENRVRRVRALRETQALRDGRLRTAH